MFVMDAASPSSSTPHSSVTGGGQKQPPPPPLPQRANGCVTQTDATQPPPPDAENDSCNSNNSRKQNTGVQLVQRQQATSPQQNQRVPDIATAAAVKSSVVPTSPEQATSSSNKHQTPDSNHQTTMLASCEPVTPPLASSKMRLKRIKAKYERQSHLSYAKLRELRQLTKTSKTRLRKLSSSGESRQHGNGVKVQGRHERHSQEMLVSRDGNVTRGSLHNNHIPRRHLSQTPQVTSSTRDNEAGVTHVAETLEIPTDPKSWSSQEVQKWLSSTLDDFYARHLATLTVDGALLCLLSKDQLQQRVPDFTSFMLDALESWKQEAAKATTSPLVSSTETASINSLKQHATNGWERNNNVVTKTDSNANYDDYSKPTYSEKIMHDRVLDDDDDDDDDIHSLHEKNDSTRPDNRSWLNGTPVKVEIEDGKVSAPHTPSLPKIIEPVSSQNQAQFPRNEPQKSPVVKPYLPIQNSVKENYDDNLRGPYRQISTESTTSTEGALVIDERATPTMNSNPLEDQSKIILEEASEKEQEYLAKECSGDQLRKLESVVAKSVQNVAPALTSSARDAPKEQAHNGLKRRKSENERLKGFSKKLKLKITPQNSFDEEEKKIEEKKFDSLPFAAKDPQSAPVLADAYNKGYQDASRLKELILKSKLTGVPVFPPPFLFSTPSLPGTPTKMPTIDFQFPNVLHSPVPTSPHTPRTPHTPHTPHTPPILTPIMKSPLRRLSPLATTSSSANSVEVKKEPVSPHAQAPATSNHFLKVPEPVFRTPSPLRSGTSPNPLQNGFAPYHDPDTPLDLSSDSKRNTPIPTPSPSALIPRLLLPRSFSMPMGMGSASGSDGHHHHHHQSESGQSSTMIHPLALSGSSFTQQAPSSCSPTPEQGSGVTVGSTGGSAGSGSTGYMSLSSMEGGDSDPSETETPSGQIGNPQFPEVAFGSPSSACGSPSTGSVPRIGRIKLWEFLLELLGDNKQTCITWLHEHQGIFKILNSEQVANLWGKRKGLSSMNYDKLSRSIRQYYKQGIIQKTNDSKRLVYQFDLKFIDMYNAKFRTTATTTARFGGSRPNLHSSAQQEQQKPLGLTHGLGLGLGQNRNGGVEITVTPHGQGQGQRNGRNGFESAPVSLSSLHNLYLSNNFNEKK